MLALNNAKEELYIDIVKMLVPTNAHVHILNQHSQRHVFTPKEKNGKKDDRGQPGSPG